VLKRQFLLQFAYSPFGGTSGIVRVVSLRMPQFRVDIPLEMSPYVHQVEASTRAFVRRFDLAATEADRHHHERSLLGTLMSRAYPHSGLTELALVTDWISCMLVLDDQFDETDLGLAPDRLRAVAAEIISWLRADGVVEDPATAGAEFPLTAVFRPAFADLWRRTREYTSPTWRRRMAGHIAAFFDTCAWEAENRLAHRVPTFKEYLDRRGIALMPYLDLIEVTTHAEVPEEIYQLPEFVELNQALSDADLWTNDIFSCEKEALLGDPHNMVLVYQHEFGVDMQTAVDVAGEMTQERFDRFAELSRMFPDEVLGDDVDPSTQDLIRAHVAGLGSWLTGQLQWRYESLRFDPTRPEVISAAGTTPLASSSLRGED